MLLDIGTSDSESGEELISSKPPCINAVTLHDQIRRSGCFNFEGCQVTLDDNGLNYKVFENKLKLYKDKDLSKFVRFGWPLGHDGSLIECKAKKNHQGARLFPDYVDEYIKIEKKQARILGPFFKNPFEGPIAISPLNTLEKKGSTDRRIISDLSFPDGKAVNNGINKDEYLGNQIKTQYPTVDSLIELILKHGQGCQLYKRDMRKAFRQIRVDPGDIHLLCFKWNDMIYCDTVLAMGLRSAAYICQRLTNGISFICKNEGHEIVNYLDDFCGVERPENAEESFVYLKDLLGLLGVEEATRKAISPSTRVAFLGIWFDTEKMTMEVTPERLLEIKSLTATWLKKNKATVKEVQSIIGKVNFVAKCVRPARIFIGRMLNFLREMSHKGKSKVTDDFKGDIKWWNEFLPTFNGISLISKEIWSNPDEIIASDACLTGCGATCGREFFHKEFPATVLVKEWHINALELLALIVAITVWAKNLTGRRVTVLCDNTATVWVINTGKTRDKVMQMLLRELCYITATNKFEIVAQHIPGVENRLPDMLSRWSTSPELKNKFLHEEIHNFSLEVNVCDDLFNTDKLRW